MGSNTDHKEKYTLWLNNLADSDPLKKELIDIDDADIEDRFYVDLSFGTAGLRGKVGAGTNRMNRLTVGRAACGIGRFIQASDTGDPDKSDPPAPDVIIARDARHKSDEFCRLSAGILASMGINVCVFDDIRSTPMLAYMIRRLNALCGINITASHNPKEYNGYKVYWDDGCQVSADIAEGMSRMIEAVDMWNDIPDFNYDELLRAGKIRVLDDSFDREYLDRIEKLAIHDDPLLDLTIPMVYTPLNGCGAKPFSQMLEDRGFTNWIMVPEQSNPDPDFKTVGYPNPEDPAAFALSEKYGAQTDAELLLATDPDADRFAVEVKGPDGKYIPLNGNQTGYILVNYILEGLSYNDHAGSKEMKEDPPHKYAMVRSIVTSNLSDIICDAYGVDMFETLTGFKNICGWIPWLHERGYTYLLGYEESIGYAPCEDIRDKDGISTGMLMAEAAAYYRKQGKSLWDVLENIYTEFGYFAEDAASIIQEGPSGKARIDKMMETIRNKTPGDISGHKVTKVIDHINGYKKDLPQGGYYDIPPQNALRIYLDNDSWFAVRPSGTEPKIKFYFYSRQSSREEALAVNSRIRDSVISLMESSCRDL